MKGVITRQVLKRRGPVRSAATARRPQKSAPAAATHARAHTRVIRRAPSASAPGHTQSPAPAAGTATAGSSLPYLAGVSQRCWRKVGAATGNSGVPGLQHAGPARGLGATALRDLHAAPAATTRPEWAALAFEQAQAGMKPRPASWSGCAHQAHAPWPRRARAGFRLRRAKRPRRPGSSEGCCGNGRRLQGFQVHAGQIGPGDPAEGLARDAAHVFGLGHALEKPGHEARIAQPAQRADEAPALDAVGRRGLSEACDSPAHDVRPLHAKSCAASARAPGRHRTAAGPACCTATASTCSEARLSPSRLAADGGAASPPQDCHR